MLSIPTNRLLIGSSALGYFFFAGLATFLVTFVEGQYHVGPAETTLVLLLLVIASVIGTLVSGRVTDALVRRGAVEARMWVPAVCYIGATALFIPGVLGHSLTPALWFDIAGAALLSAANPPLDAARLDIMPAGLWGRAESTRTVARSLAQALAPDRVRADGRPDQRSAPRAGADRHPRAQGRPSTAPSGSSTPS